MKRKYFLTIFLLFQIIFLQILKCFPEFVERFYSNGLYQIISKTSRIVFGKIPFSIGDCIYGILILLVIKWFWKIRKSWKVGFKENILSVLNYISIFYFLFHLLWAFNYYRQPLFEKMNIEKKYSETELINFTEKLIHKTNEVHFKITKSDTIKVVFPYSDYQSFKINLKGYRNLSKEYIYFKYKDLSVKKSAFSLPLSYMGFGGYLNPFTNEAQLNDLLPKYNFPSTTCHEMAHQLGYASESECNFIGFLAAIKNDNLYFKYSGYSNALRYCLSNLEHKNPAMAEKLFKGVNKGVLKNYQENIDFSITYDSFIDKGFRVFYDHFLKLNNQKDGVESYSKFVDLLINYYKKRNF